MTIRLMQESDVQVSSHSLIINHIPCSTSLNAVINDTCLEGDVRLVGGQDQFEGRVEICLGGVWGTVCDNIWGPVIVWVLCRQLGYASDGEDSFQMTSARSDALYINLVVSLLCCCDMAVT